MTVTEIRCLTTGCTETLRMECTKCDPTWFGRLNSWYMKGKNRYCPTCCSGERTYMEDVAAQKLSAKTHCCRICIEYAEQNPPQNFSFRDIDIQRPPASETCAICACPAPWQQCPSCQPAWQARSQFHQASTGDGGQHTPDQTKRPLPTCPRRTPDAF